MVVLKLSDAATGAVNEKISIDGIETTLTATINTPPAEVGGVSGTSTALGPTTIMAGYAVGVRSEVTIPASIINKPLSFMVIPEYASTDFDVRIWTLITFISSNLILISVHMFILNCFLNVCLEVATKCIMNTTDTMISLYLSFDSTF